MRIGSWVLRLACAVAAFAVIFPQLVNLPLFSQNPAVLESALFISRNLLAIEVGCSAAAFFSLWIMLSQGLYQWQVVVGLSTFALLGISRFDVYTAIFHPLEHPAFSSAHDTRLDPREKLLAINIKGHSRAYPVRSLSYHHVVNDVLEGVAVAATY